MRMVIAGTGSSAPAGTGNASKAVNINTRRIAVAPDRQTRTAVPSLSLWQRQILELKRQIDLLHLRRQLPDKLGRFFHIVRPVRAHGVIQTIVPTSSAAAGVEEFALGVLEFDVTEDPLKELAKLLARHICAGNIDLDFDR